MKSSEVYAAMKKDVSPMIAGEYRGHQLETINFVDKTTGRQTSMELLHISLECGEAGKQVRVDVSDKTGILIKAMVATCTAMKKGDRVLASVSGWAIIKGQLTCRGSALYLVEEKA